MFKKLFYLTILFLLFLSCKNDDDNKIKYLSPEEQKVVDKKGIDFLRENYYFSEQNEITRCEEDCASDKGKILLKYLEPIPNTNGAYYIAFKDKEGTGPSPDPKKDTILINFGITYFRANKSSDNKNKISISQLGKIGNIYSGTEAVKNPDFYYYSFDKYISESRSYSGGRYDLYSLSERNRIKKIYEDNNFYERNVIEEFVEGIKKFKSREATINSPLKIQGIIIAPSANSKGLESYLSLGGVPKDCILVFTIDLLSVKKAKDDK